MRFSARSRYHLSHESPSVKSASLSAFFIVALTWLLLIKVVRVHRVRATIAVMVAVGPLLWALGRPLPTVLMGTLGALIVIIKTLPDWHRIYPNSPRHGEKPADSQA